MLSFLRKVLGLAALAWLSLCLRSLVTYFVNPKAAGIAFLDMVFTSYVGVPAGIIWAVLKVVSVLNPPRREGPAAPGAGNLPSQVSTGGAIQPETPGAVPEAKRTDPASSTFPPGPDVYTYSARGMPMCPECGQRPAIFYCSTHHSAVCLGCVVRHDDPGGCVYVPAFRAPKPAAGLGKTSGPAKSTSEGSPEPGSVSLEGAAPRAGKRRIRSKSLRALRTK
jgi:hypothetical protein